LPSKDHVLGLSVSSLVLAKIPNVATGKDVIRPYTPVTECDKRGSFDLIVKIYEKGAFGQLLKNTKVGDEVSFKGPLVKFEYKPSTWSTVGMIAGGSGITPMLQVAYHILRNPEGFSS
jgi:cytochrome-b5 reductase